MALLSNKMQQLRFLFAMALLLVGLISPLQNQHFSCTVLCTRVAGLIHRFLLYFLQTIQYNEINRQNSIL